MKTLGRCNSDLTVLNLYPQSGDEASQATNHAVGLQLRFTGSAELSTQGNTCDSPPSPPHLL